MLYPSYSSLGSVAHTRGSQDLPKKMPHMRRREDRSSPETTTVSHHRLSTRNLRQTKLAPTKVMDNGR